jgi:hypothetical protein
MSHVSAVLLMLVPDAAGSASPAGLDGVVVTTVAAAIALLRWLVKREIAELAVSLGARLTPAHASAIDAAVDRAAAEIAAALEPLAEGTLKARLGPILATTEASAILRYLPQAATALGLTPETLSARITAALGDPLTPAPSAARPIGQPDHP